MITVDFSTESRYPVDRETIRAKVVSKMEEAGIKDAKVSVTVVGTRKMRELSKKYLGNQELHEVLSFVYEDPGDDVPFVDPPESPVLGDVVVCFPEAVRLSGVQNKMVDQEIAYLVGHGCEHLLGKHHL